MKTWPERQFDWWETLEINKRTHLLMNSQPCWLTACRGGQYVVRLACHGSVNMSAALQSTTTAAGVIMHLYTNERQVSAVRSVINSRSVSFLSSAALVWSELKQPAL